MAAPEQAPAGLSADHVLFAVDYDVHDPALHGVYDPRLVTLTAGGSLILPERNVDATFAATATALDAAGLARAWLAIVRSGVFRDGHLPLPGFANRTVTTATHVFRVDDGARATRLVIDDLGSEEIFGGDPLIPPDERSLRGAAARLIEDLQAMGGDAPWTPVGLLLWWRGELPADWDAAVVPWPLPVDLAAGGRPLVHPVWQRCLRVDGSLAADIAGFARSLPIDHLVDHAGIRYAIQLRPIHPDEADAVHCP